MTRKDKLRSTIEFIRRVSKTDIPEISLKGKDLYEIPKEIAQAVNVRQLDLSNNCLASLPIEIEKLYKLTRLDLGGNLLTTFPTVVTRLSNLNTLILGGNELVTLPEEMEELTDLKYLDLSGNPLVEIPQVVFGLKKLETLKLNDAQLHMVSPKISQLTRLGILALYRNQLKELPAEIGLLNYLVELDISNNELEALPKELFKLQNLRILKAGNFLRHKETKIITSNKIAYIPKDIEKMEGLKHLDLRGNPLGIPLEIIDKTNDPQAIIRYYLELVAKKTKKPISQIKLILVGQGSVGKTSLIQRIVRDTFDQYQSKTEGISIDQWKVKDNQPDTSGTNINFPFIKLSIWDFGGQEIMHATHQFFLTKRSLYLLVLDSRLTQEENRLEYWLKIIQSFGGDSPVLIVGNKIDQHPLDIDRTGLQKKYTNIVGILETSAATGAGIEDLKSAITGQVNNLPHVRDLLPETWFTVKNQLEALGLKQNFITQDRYLELCIENEITDETSQRTLIGFLHDLGVVLHFQDDPRLEALGILNPQWVTNGVYKILNSHVLFDNKGVLERSMLDEILNFPEYPANKRLFIVDMMRKFELCYDIEPDKIFLVPDLLPKDEPFTGEWKNALVFQYHYNVLPSSIITRFIVRMEAFVHRPTTWRAGTLLKSKGNTALVKADYEDRTISIRVTGNQSTRRDFLCMIRGAFESIHKTIARIEVEAQMPHPDHPDLILDHSELIEFERQGIKEFPRKVGSQVIMVNVRQLLAGIEGSPDSQVFISYSHKDEGFVKKLAKDLSQAGVPVWQDLRSLEGGDIWMDEIGQSILQCKIFLVVLTPDMLASEWVKKEYTYALSKRRKIVPILYLECDLPFALTNIQFIDFVHKPYEAALSELENIIKQAE